MNKVFVIGLFLCGFTVFLWNSKLIYFPSDISNLFPLYHNSSVGIPHNTLVYDPYAQFEPWRNFAKQQILRGDVPLWNQYNGSGVPLLANSQSALLFPLTILYYMLPIQISLNFIPLLKLTLLFLFTFLFLRSIELRRIPSLVGGLSVMVSGFSIVWLLWPHTNVYLFLPLLLYLTEKMRSGRQSIRYAIALSLAYCFAVFGGHLETLLHIMILHTFYMVYRMRFGKPFFISLLFIFLGLLLACIQLIPFMEYLMNSYALFVRTHTEYSYLPLSSSLLFLLPFLSGAPHIAYYKPISPVSNFQEAMSGYTGLVILIGGLISALKFFKFDSRIKFWVIMWLFFLLLSFKIWPVGLILELPLLAQSQNSRFAALAAFCSIVVFSIGVDKLSLLSFTKLLYAKKILLVSIISFFSVLVFVVITVGDYHPYVRTLLLHILIIAVTTYLFVTIVQFQGSKLKNWIYIVIGILIFTQTGLMLINYIPLLSTNRYYPTTHIIKSLKKDPNSKYLEIGNPSLVPPTNVVYSIKSAENYDALEIEEYKKAFDAEFPFKNHWNKVDVFAYENLRRFGINYIISDYNPNFFRVPIQPQYQEILGPVSNNTSFVVDFIADKATLSQIRILPANYNRVNSCIMTIRIEDINTKPLHTKKIHCSSLLDKMFHTYDVSDVILVKGKKYKLIINFENATINNSIGLWGENSIPYIEFFYLQNTNNNYEFVAVDGNAKLYKVKNIKSIDLSNYKLLHIDQTNMLLTYELLENELVEVKQAYYPGWKAAIDGKAVALTNSRPFMAVNLPKGKHVLKIYYDATVFRLGAFLSLIGVLILFFIWLKYENFSALKKNHQRLCNRVARIMKKLTIFDSFLMGCLFIVMFLLLTLFQLTVPSDIPLKFTTVVNWFNVHNHSILVDYVRFGLFIFSVIISGFFSFLIILWRKNKQ